MQKTQTVGTDSEDGKHKEGAADKTEQNEQSTKPAVASGEQVVDTNERAQHAQNQETGALQNHHQDWVDVMNAYSTLIIAIFTMLLFSVACLQIWQVFNSERAWILGTFVNENPQFATNASDSVSYTFNFEIRNEGRTVAHITRAELLQLNSLDDLKNSEKLSSDNEKLNYILAPKGTAPMSIGLPAHFTRDVNGGTASLYILLCADYTTFKTKRRTRVVFEYLGPQQMANRIDPPRMTSVLDSSGYT